MLVNYLKSMDESMEKLNLFFRTKEKNSSYNLFASNFVVEL